jgi:hypothetical protein
MHRICRALVLCLAVSAAFPADKDYLIWIPRSPSADPLYRFIKGDKSGYIDQTGKIVIPLILPYFGGNSGHEFHDGLLEIAVSDGVYVDTTGMKVIDKGFFRGWDFSEGLAVAMRKGEKKWGYIDKTGEFAISPRFDSVPKGYVSSFQDGFAKIEIDGKIGYIDHSGKFAIPPRFPEGESFKNSMARVAVGQPCSYPKNPCRYTFIDKTGRILIDQRYEEARNFAEGLAPVRVGQHWGFIDMNGAMAIPPRFDGVEEFSEGLASVSIVEHDERSIRIQRGYIDHSGTYVIPPQYWYAESFSEGVTVVGDRETYWYIDHRGKQAIPGKFARASPFFKGLAHVAIAEENSFAYIDRNGMRAFIYKQ